MENENCLKCKDWEDFPIELDGGCCPVCGGN